MTEMLIAQLTDLHVRPEGQGAPYVLDDADLDLGEPGGAGGLVLEPPAFALHRWTGESLVSHLALVESFPGPFPFVLDEAYPGRG